MESWYILFTYGRGDGVWYLFWQVGDVWGSEAYPSLKENKCPISGKTTKITTNKMAKNTIFWFLKFIINYDKKFKNFIV
jgi:hypothetical protein